LDLSTLINYLSAISSIAVILGAIFVVFQLRQNAKLIQLTIHENRSSIAFALLEKITDESFALRRKKMHDVIKNAREANWGVLTIRWTILKRGILHTSTN
jgi:formate-dependent nitrite reductase membrane component NrfD